MRDECCTRCRTSCTGILYCTQLQYDVCNNIKMCHTAERVFETGKRQMFTTWNIIPPDHHKPVTSRPDPAHIFLALGNTVLLMLTITSHSLQYPPPPEQQFCTDTGAISPPLWGVRLESKSRRHRCPQSFQTTQVYRRAVFCIFLDIGSPPIATTSFTAAMYPSM